MNQLSSELKMKRMIIYSILIKNILFIFKLDQEKIDFVNFEITCNKDYLIITINIIRRKFCEAVLCFFTNFVEFLPKSIS